MAEMIGFTTRTTLYGPRRYSEKVPEINRMTIFSEQAQCPRECL